MNSRRRRHSPGQLHSRHDTRKAVEFVAGRVPLETSGGITLETVRRLCRSRRRLHFHRRADTFCSSGRYPSARHSRIIHGPKTRRASLRPDAKHDDRGFRREARARSRRFAFDARALGRKTSRCRHRNSRRVVYRLPARSIARCAAAAADSSAAAHADSSGGTCITSTTSIRRILFAGRSARSRPEGSGRNRRSLRNPRPQAAADSDEAGIPSAKPGSIFRGAFSKAPPSLAPLFTLATAVAMHNAVERYTGLDIDIKWPNDLLIGGKKFCGILSEIQAEVDLVKTMIIGVGLNVNHERLPEDIAGRATSLRMASGRIQSRNRDSVGVFRGVRNHLHGFRTKGTARHYRPMDALFQLRQWPQDRDSRRRPEDFRNHSRVESSRRVARSSRKAANRRGLQRRRRDMGITCG